MFDLKSRLLIVDDMLTMRKLVSKACREIGFTDITEAADGNLAWTALTAANPPINLVISDWNMPNCSGLDFLKKVRADSKLMKLPFVLLTAEAEVSQVKEAVAAGVTNYIVKPFTANTLREKLEIAHQKTLKIG